MLSSTGLAGLLAHSGPTAPGTSAGSTTPTTVVVVVTLVTVLAMLVGVIAGAVSARAGDGRGRLAPAVAGALLLALVLGDLLPDALQDGAELPGGAASALGVAVLGLGGGALLLGRRSGGGRQGRTGTPGTRVLGCCSAAAGTVTALALATHGAAEGLVVGLGADLRPGTALAVVSIVALHRLAEGFALGTAMRRSGTRRTRALTLTGCAVLSPLLGGALAGAFSLGEAASAVVTAALAGLLVAVSAALLAAVLRPRPEVPADPVRPPVPGGSAAVGVCIRRGGA